MGKSDCLEFLKKIIIMSKIGQYWAQSQYFLIFL